MGPKKILNGPRRKKFALPCLIAFGSEHFEDYNDDGFTTISTERKIKSGFSAFGKIPEKNISSKIGLTKKDFWMK